VIQKIWQLPFEFPVLPEQRDHELIAVVLSKTSRGEIQFVLPVRVCTVLKHEFRNLYVPGHYGVQRAAAHVTFGCNISARIQQNPYGMSVPQSAAT